MWAPKGMFALPAMVGCPCSIQPSNLTIIISLLQPLDFLRRPLQLSAANLNELPKMPSLQHLPLSKHLLVISCAFKQKKKEHPQQNNILSFSLSFGSSRQQSINEVAIAPSGLTR